jgi:hypothetical protein
VQRVSCFFPCKVGKTDLFFYLLKLHRPSDSKNPLKTLEKKKLNIASFCCFGTEWLIVHFTVMREFKFAEECTVADPRAVRGALETF